MNISPFAPQYGQGVGVAASATSANDTFRKGSHQMYILNTANVPVFIRVGTGALAATAADLPIPPSFAGGIVISIPQDADTVAAICPTGTGTVYFIPGSGM